MQFTTLRSLLTHHINLIVHAEDSVVANQFIIQPTLTRDAVFEELERLPMLEVVKSFHLCYATDSHEVAEVRDLYRDAGGAMVQCLEELENLKILVRGGHDPSLLDFRYPSRLIKYCVDGWYRSIGAPEFKRREHSRRMIRFRYLEYASAIIYALGKLIMPSSLQPYVRGLGEALHGGQYEQLLILDSAITHAQHQLEYSEIELFAPPGKYPQNYENHGATALIPYYVVNEATQGNRYIRNAKCKRKDQPNPEYLNSVCRNPRYIKTAGLDEDLPFRPVSTGLGLETDFYEYTLLEWFVMLRPVQERT